MPDTGFNLDASIERIGYRRSREVSVEVLYALAAAHEESIPFENLDLPLLD